MYRILAACRATTPGTLADDLGCLAALALLAAAAYPLLVL